MCTGAPTENVSSEMPATAASEITTTAATATIRIIHFVSINTPLTIISTSPLPPLPFPSVLSASSTVKVLAGLPVSDSPVSGGTSNQYCNNKCGSGTDDGPWSTARFGYPVACVLAGDGYLYVTDAYYHAVRRVSTSPSLAGGEDYRGSGISRLSPRGVSMRMWYFGACN